MKKYVTSTKDTCWTDCIACMLEVKPERVPKFVKEFGNKYMDATRAWLKANFGKGIVYIPARAFMETSGIRQNGPLGPEGYSIVHLSMVDDRSRHVAIAYNGGVVYDNGDSREAEYDTILGFFVMYDLEPAKAKLIKKPKKHKRKRK
jgi:hypothetical protein